MKKIFILIITIFILQLNAELINLNPDPDGDPWYAGELRPLTEEDWQKLDAMPRLTIPENLRNRELPDSLDNSLNQYFRPVFSQEGGSCGQASGVGYNFTYEINFARQTAANVPGNQYPTHFTWNFLNRGVGYGSWYWDGWEIIKSNGCPTVATYGGMAAGGNPAGCPAMMITIPACLIEPGKCWLLMFPNRQGWKSLKTGCTIIWKKTRWGTG